MHHVGRARSTGFVVVGAHHMAGPQLTWLLLSAASPSAVLSHPHKEKDNSSLYGGACCWRYVLQLLHRKNVQPLWVKLSPARMASASQRAMATAVAAAIRTTISGSGQQQSPRICLHPGKTAHPTSIHSTLPKVVRWHRASPASAVVSSALVLAEVHPTRCLLPWQEC